MPPAHRPSNLLPTGETSNAGLVVFRVLFGLLMAAESFGAIATGWVRVNLVEPRLTFPILGAALGHDWLALLRGPHMTAYFAVMGLAALAVAAGLRYRVSATLLAALWTGAYLAQTNSYNNHYYLAVLVAWAMVFAPAHRRAALDARRTGRRETTCAAWIPAAFRLQLGVVFVFAAVAKLEPGWLSGDFLAVRLGDGSGVPVIGPLVAAPGFQRLVVFTAIAFDALVVPALAWRRTRPAAFAGLVLFNGFNSLVFRIGIFPYMVLAWTVFFFRPPAVERAFRWLPGLGETPARQAPSRLRRAPRWVVAYFVLQLLLPLRHHLFPGDVSWTEEGHRMSWRMMLRTKSGSLALVARDPAGERSWIVDQDEHLTERQRAGVATRPDMLLQYARFLVELHEAGGRPGIELYPRGSLVSLNGGPTRPLFAPDVDLARARWRELGHEPWIVDRAQPAR